MSTPDVTEATQALRAFLKDMKQWNDDSARGQGENYERLATVISRHCTPRDMSNVGVSYSDESEWDPAEEIQQIDDCGDDRLEISTLRHLKARNNKERYRYELLRVDGRWLVDGRYSVHTDAAYASFIAPLLARRSEPLWNLYEQHALGTFARQVHLVQLIGKVSYEFDTDSGVLSFENGYRWNAQILGSESEESFTWLWSWANTESDLPEEVIQAALAMKRYGQEHGIEHFVERKLPINEVDGRFLATLAVGMLHGDAWYTCDYDGGAAFLLIKDPSFPQPPAEYMEKLKAGLEKFCSDNPSLSRRRALVRFVDEEAGELLMGEQKSSAPPPEIARQADIEYDDQGRVSKVTATLTPESGGLLRKISGWLSGR